MAACPRSRGRAFFNGLYPVGICRNALCFMAAPSVGRRSRQRQGVVSLRGKENGGLDFVKAAVSVFRAWRLPAERRLFFFCRRSAETLFTLILLRSEYSLNSRFR